MKAELVTFLPALIAVVVLIILMDATVVQAVLVGGGFGIISAIAKRLIFGRF